MRGLLSAVAIGAVVAEAGALGRDLSSFNTRCYFRNFFRKCLVRSRTLPATYPCLDATSDLHALFRRKRLAQLVGGEFALGDARDIDRATG